MLKKKILNNSSVILKWLASYAIILFIPILASSISYIMTYDVIEKQITQSNSILLAKVQKEVDALLNDVDRLSVEILLNPGVHEIESYMAEITGSQYYNITQTAQSLKNYVYSYKDISDYFIYFKNSDMIMSSNRSIDSKSYYDVSFKDSSMTYEQWQKLLDSKYNRAYILMPDEGIKSKYVIYVRSIQQADMNAANANLYILINKAKLLEKARELNAGDGGYTFILDKSNNIITSTIPSLIFNEDLYKSLTADEGLLHTSMNGKKVIVSFIGSKINDWKYITVIPSQVFWDKLIYSRRIMVASVLGCLILGGMLIVFLLKKNYDPLNRLLKIINANKEKLFNRKSNEYSFIENAVLKTMNEKVEISRKLFLQNKVLRTNFMEKLIRGEIKSKKSLDEYLVSFQIEFGSDYFAVILFHIDTAGEALLEGENDHDLVQFIMTNIVEEIIGYKHQGFMLELDDILVCLVNLSGFEEFKEQEAINELKAIINEAEELIGKHYKIGFSTSISNVHRSIYGIPEVYSEAQQVMELKLAMGIKGISSYHDIIHLTGNGLYYPVEKEHGLINSLKAADCKSAEAIMKEVFYVNFAGKAPSKQLKYCFVYAFMNTMTRAIGDIKKINGFDFTILIKNIDELIHYENIHDIMKQIYGIIESFCEKVKIKSNNNQMIDEIISHIGNNYMDTDLSIQAIAEKIGIHPGYLSQMFKEKTGEGLLEYVHRVRIMEAQTLLKAEKGILLDDIANRVGFANVRTFIRVFKSQAGITPGKYRGIV